MVDDRKMYEPQRGKARLLKHTAKCYHSHLMNEFLDISRSSRSEFIGWLQTFDDIACSMKTVYQTSAGALNSEKENTLVQA